MKDLLLETIQKTWTFGQEDRLLLVDSMVEHQIPKNECLLRQGQVCQSFYFIQQGAIYQYRLNQDMEEEVLGLHTQGDWVINAKSFTGQAPSETNIEAFTDCWVSELRIEVIHHLINQSNAFFQLGNLLQYGDRRLDFFSSDKGPDERYLQLLRERPEILKTFPLKYIASYLNMTPETLSRVRRRVT